MSVMNIGKNFLTAFVLLACCAGCGGNDNDGFVVIKLERADLTAGLPDLAAEASQSALSLDLLKIAGFQALVTAGDIETPITATAEASADQIEIRGIPYGENRTILVEALNSRGDVLRRRRLEGLEIKKGVVSNVEGRWNTVPLALNLADGSVLSAERFRVLGFGEPGSPIRVSSVSDAGGAVAFVSLNETVPQTVVSPSLSSGLFNFRQRPSALGRQTLTLRDENNGETSSVTVYVIEGEPPGRRLVSAGGLGPTVTIGSAMGGLRTGHFPLVLQALSKKKSEE